MQEVNLYYWNQAYNFGDVLSPYIVARLSGKRVKYENPAPRLLASGSILGSSKSGDIIWGTGLRLPEIRMNLDLKIHAVRGPLTRHILMSHGYQCPRIYGHPALLLPRFFKPIATLRSGVGVMPHMSDRWLRGGDKFIKTDGDVVETINAILSCEILVTSTLTGFVIAEAFGIPAVILRHPFHVKLEPAFKYCDYFAGTGRDTQMLVGSSIDEAVKFARNIEPLKWDPDPFIQAFWSIVNVHLRTKTVGAGGDRQEPKRYCNSPGCICHDKAPAQETQTEVHS